MKSVTALLIKKDSRWFLTPINTFERIISKQDVTHIKTPEQYLYKHRQIFWFHPNSIMPDTISGIIILLNINIKEETKAIAISVDTPPFIIELNEDNITWTDPLNTIVQIYIGQQHYTAQILDENTFAD